MESFCLSVITTSIRPNTSVLARQLCACRGKSSLCVCVLLSEHTAAMKSGEQSVCFCFDLYRALPILDVLERVLSLLRAAWRRFPAARSSQLLCCDQRFTQEATGAWKTWLQHQSKAVKTGLQEIRPLSNIPTLSTTELMGLSRQDHVSLKNLSMMGVAGPLLCRLKGLDLSSSRDLNSSNGSMLSQRIAWVAVAVIWISVIPQWLWLKMYFLISFPPPTFIHHTVHHKVFHSNFILDKNYPCGWQNEEHAFISFLICYLCGNLTARSGRERV